MKKLWFGILATLLLTVLVAPAFAWDFSMTGQFEWRFRYFGRANGYQDLFGDMRFQDSILNNTGQIIGFAGPNFYRGYNGNTASPMNTHYWGDQIRIVKGGFSYADSDTFAHDQRMTFAPEIRINNAIRFRGVFDLASIRHKYNHRDYETNGPLDRWYQDRTSANAFDTAMIPSFSQWHASAQLPWGIVQLGARDFAWGTGAVLGLNTRNDSLLFVLPYGPFRFIPQVWLANLPNGYGAFTPYGTQALSAAGIAAAQPAPNTVVNYDGGEHYPVWWSVVMTYDSGPVTLGGGFLQLFQHSNNANVVGEGFPGAGYRPVFYNPDEPSPDNLRLWWRGFGWPGVYYLFEIQ